MTVDQIFTLAGELAALDALLKEHLPRVHEKIHEWLNGNDDNSSNSPGDDSTPSDNKPILIPLPPPPTGGGDETVYTVLGISTSAPAFGYSVVYAGQRVGLNVPFSVKNDLHMRKLELSRLA